MASRAGRVSVATSTPVICNNSPMRALSTHAIAPVPTSLPHRRHTRATDVSSTREPVATCRQGHAKVLPPCVPDEGRGIVTFTDGHYGTHTVDLTTQCGDFIVRRKDGAWAYQLAVVVDDALMGINEVVRGRDLLLSSPQQIYLAKQLGFTPPRFTHLPLLCNTAGQRLSKRDKSLDMGCLRQRFTPNQIIGLLAHAAGLQSTPDAVSAQSLVKTFSWNKVVTADITFML